MTLQEVEACNVGLRVLATVVCFLGCSTNILVIVLSRLAPKNDTRSFVILFQVNCAANALNCLTGWLVLNVVSISPDYVVFIPFGPAALIGPRTVYILDLFTIFSNTYIPPMIGVMMLFRTWILFNRKLTKRYLFVGIFVLLCYSAPQFFCTLYVDIDLVRPKMEQDPELLNATYVHVSYGGQMTALGWIYWEITNIAPAAVFFTCVFLRIVMAWKLRQLVTHISQSSRKVHSAFMNILTFDAAVVFIYFIGSNTAFFRQLSSFSSFFALIISTFPYPFFSGPTIIQAVALLVFVPYLRRTLAGLFERRKEHVIVYFMFCLFVTVTLLFNIFGCRRDLAEYCRNKGIKISFKVPPVCCFSFLPEIECTDENLRRIEWLVFQTPILRTTLELISVVVFMELGHRHNLWFMLAQLFGLLSMCIAFYGCYVIVPLGRGVHAPYKFDFIFRVVDIAQCIYTIQKFCFDFGATFEIIAADRVLTASTKAQCESFGLES